MNWWKRLNIDLRRNVRLSGYTTFGIGGKADYFARPSGVAALAALLAECRRQRLPLRVIGAGSNLLVSDKGVRGVVVSLSAPAFSRIRRKGYTLDVGAGVRLSRLVGYCCRQGIGGTEFLSGIPGTLGGALWMNAGAHDASIGDLVETVAIMHYNGAVQILNRGEISFSYRWSSLRDSIILGARLKCRRAGVSAATAAVRAYLLDRRSKQDIAARSAGCVFKNPAPERAAGYLIDQCGGKLLRCGGAAVSSKHANFIVADGAATAADVRRLMRLIQAKVKKRFGLKLEPEIELWQ